MNYSKLFSIFIFSTVLVAALVFPKSTIGNFREVDPVSTIKEKHANVVGVLIQNERNRTRADFESSVRKRRSLTMKEENEAWLWLASDALKQHKWRLSFQYYQNFLLQASRFSSSETYTSRKSCELANHFRKTKVVTKCIQHFTASSKLGEASLGFKLEFAQLSRRKASLSTVKSTLKRYFKRFRAHQRTPETLESLVKVLMPFPKMKSSYYDALEGVAAAYPLSKKSYTAFKTILSLHGKKLYTPSEWFLKRIATHAELADDIIPFITASVQTGLRRNKRTVYLNYLEKSNLYVDLKLYDLAESNLQLASRDKPGQKSMILSEIELKKGNLEASEALLKRVLLYEKPSTRIRKKALQRLAYVLRMQSKHTEAAQAYEQAYAKTKTRKLRYKSFLTRFLARSYEKAQYALSKLTRRNFPDKDADAALVFWQAKNHTAQGNKAQFLQKLKQLQLRHPNSFYTLIAPIEFDTPAHPLNAIDLKKRHKFTSIGYLDGLWNRAKNTFSIARSPQATTTFETPLELPNQIQEITRRISEKVNISQALVLAIIENESAFENSAQSWVGASGLMQLMPKTAFKVSEILNDDQFSFEKVYDPSYNVLLGSTYLKFLQNFYDGSILTSVAAYNAGPDAVNSWIQACNGCSSGEFVEFIPFNETRRYVKKVIKSFWKYSKALSEPVDSKAIFTVPSQLRSDVILF